MRSTHSQQQDHTFLGRQRVCIELLRQQPLRNAVVVDVGSTFGWLEKELATSDVADIIGVEPNDKLRTRAQHMVPGSRFLAGDASSIPLPDESADIITLFDVIEHVPRSTEGQCLTEIHRVLKPGGRLLLSTPNAHWLTTLLDPAWYFGHRHYTPSMLTTLLKRAGLTLTSLRIQGGAACIGHLWLFYVQKWVLRSQKPAQNWLTALDDVSWQQPGFFEIVLVAEKA